MANVGLVLFALLTSNFLHEGVGLAFLIVAFIYAYSAGPFWSYWRLKDCGKSGWWLVVAILIPGVNILLAIYLFAAPTKPRLKKEPSETDLEVIEKKLEGSPEEITDRISGINHFL